MTRPSSIRADETEDPASVRSSITSTDLSRIRREFWIPGDFVLRVPNPRQRVFDVVSVGVFFYEESFRAGLRLPFHPVVQGILRHYRISPTMVAPNSWRHIVGFISLCALVGVTATVPLFRACHHLVLSRTSAWAYIGPRKSFKLLIGIPSSIKGWKSRFFIVEWREEESIPRNWELGPSEDCNREPKLSKQEVEDLKILRDSPPIAIGNVLSDESLFNAGLSEVDPRAAARANLGASLREQIRSEAAEKSEAEGQQALELVKDLSHDSLPQERALILPPPRRADPSGGALPISTKSAEKKKKKKQRLVHKPWSPIVQSGELESAEAPEGSLSPSLKKKKTRLIWMADLSSGAHGPSSGGRRRRHEIVEVAGGSESRSSKRRRLQTHPAEVAVQSEPSRRRRASADRQRRLLGDDFPISAESDWDSILEEMENLSEANHQEMVHASKNCLFRCMVLLERLSKRWAEAAAERARDQAQRSQASAEEVAQMEAERTSLRRQVADLSARLEEAEGEFEGARRQLELDEAEAVRFRAEADGKITSLQAEIVNEHRRVSILQRRHSELETELSSAKRNLREVRNERDSLRAEVAEFGRHRQVVEESLAALTHERDDFQSQLSVATESFSNLKSQMENAIDTYLNSADFDKERMRLSTEAYALSAKETRGRILQEYPDLDLSFLEAEGYFRPSPKANVEASVAEEDSEYEDDDLDIAYEVASEGDTPAAETGADTILPSEEAAPPEIVTTEVPSEAEAPGEAIPATGEAAEEVVPSEAEVAGSPRVEGESSILSAIFEDP